MQTSLQEASDMRRASLHASDFFTIIRDHTQDVPRTPLEP